MNPEIDPAAVAEDPPGSQPESGAAPADELARAKEEIAQVRDAWLRAKAEADNVRKIAQTDVAKAHKFAIESFAEDLLPVKDALEKALATESQTVETIKAGAELTLKALQSAFARAQVKDVEPAVGDKFDPHRHEAVAMAPSTQPPNTIVTVYEKGYLLNDRILRPAKVVVSSSSGNG